MIPNDPLIGEIIDHFRILAHLGRGGMAVVYLAQDIQLEREVVLKIVLPHIAETEGAIARFQREARATASLNHTHVIQVYSTGHTATGLPYMVMQYIPGGAFSDYLQGLIKQKQWISTTYALTLMRQVADALATAHAAGIVHRDLKPSNILLREDGAAVLTDLGIVAVQQATTQLTHTGGVLGTPHYMSPEQASGQPVDGRSDLYSLGIILYQLLYGQPPFMADSPLAVLHHHLYEQPIPLEQRRPGLSPATYEVVATCLEKDVNGRYQSAADLMSALDLALQSEGDTATSPIVVNSPAPATTEQLVAPPIQEQKRSLPPKPKRSPIRFLWGLVPLALALVLFFVWRNFLVPSPTPVDEIVAVATEHVEETAVSNSNPTAAIPTTEVASDDTAEAAPQPSETAVPPTLMPNSTAIPLSLPGGGVVRMTQNSGSQQYAPVLSPDQQTLTFMSDRNGEWQVFTMDALGGAWQEAIPNTQSYHGHFSPDGRRLILAANSNDNWDIYRMQLDGSGLEQLTSRAEKDVYPSYSPDGEWIVYMSYRDNHSGIYRMRTDGSQDQIVIDTTAEEVFPVFSPNGRFILFQSNQNGGHDIYTIPWEGGVPQQVTTHSARDGNPRYSPDGEWIAFETDRDDNYEIYLVRPDGSDLHNATNHSARDQLPAFSPDGQWLLYQSNRDGNVEIYRQAIDLSDQSNTAPSEPSGRIIFTCYINSVDEICSINADGSDEQRLTTQNSTDFYASPTQDGNEIVFSSQRSGQFLIYSMDRDGSNQQRLPLPSFDEFYSPIISPDGQRIAFAAKRSRQDVWVMNRDGTNLVQLTAVGENNVDPVWSPDGTQIAFASDRSGQYLHYIINADGSGLQPLGVSVADEGGRSDWSPDGRWLAFYGGARKNRQIYLAAIDGTVIHQLTDSGDNTAPSFSPDGNWLTFMSNRDGDNEIFIMRIDGSDVRQLTFNGRSDWQPRWGP